MNEPLSQSYFCDSDTSWHSSCVSFRSSLPVRFLVKVKFPFDILEMFHQGTQKELEFVEFYGFFGVPHLRLDSQDALRNRKQMKYHATKASSLTLTFLDASPYKPILSRLKHTIFICFLFSVYSWLNNTDDQRASVSQLVNLKGNKTVLLNPSSGIQIIMGHQTMAVPNALFCDKSQ